MSRAPSSLSLAIACALGCQPSASDPASGAPRERSAAVAHPPPPTPSSTQSLSLPGVSVEVPKDFVPLDPSQRERLLGAAQQAAPPNAEAHTELIGRRAPDGVRDGMVYVSHQTLAGGFVPLGLTVRDALAVELDELPARLRAGGLQVTHTTRDERNGGLEACASAMGEREGVDVTVNMCTLGVVDQGQRLVFLTIACFGTRRLCTSILTDRRYEPSAALPLAHELAPTPSPGLAELRRDGLGWLRFGMSRAQFQTACRDAGFQVDAFDWAVEGPVPAQWFEQGLIGRCSGLGVRVGPGNVLVLDVTFSPDDALGIANARVDASLDVMRAALTTAYPDTWAEGDHLLHFVDREARGHEVVSIGTSPTRIPGAGILVTVMSRAGSDMTLPEGPLAP